MFGSLAIAEPYPHFHVFRAGIAHHFGNVYAAIHPCDVALRKPAGIHQHVLEARLRGEVYIVLHVLSGISGLAVRPQAATPPVPRRLAGPNPRRILDGGIGIQACNNIGLNQPARLSPHQQHSPSRFVRESANDGGLRIVQVRGQPALELVAGPAAGRIREIHGGIVSQVGFGNRHPRDARHFHQQWKSYQNAAGYSALIGKAARR